MRIISKPSKLQSTDIPFTKINPVYIAFVWAAFVGILAIVNPFSITIEAFQLAGGLLVTRLGFSMLDAKSKRQTEEEKEESVQKDNISIVPLAIPMLSGPGAITRRWSG
ncbi:MAG: MarC family protein [Candidatus Aenigmatarchaeota archaeon]